MRLIACAVAVLTLSAMGAAQLNGGYTIDAAGSGGRNFTSFGAAVVALGAGINGPVVFTVASTTFRETVSLTPVSGTSPTNTITFTATSAPAILDANGGQDAVKLADGCAHFIFDNIRIVNFMRYGVWLDGQSTSPAGVTRCTFQNLEVVATGTSTRPVYLTYSDSNTFFKCVLRGGWACLFNKRSDGNVYDTCEMDGRNTSFYAAYFESNNDADNVIQNCFLHSVQNAANSWGLGMQSASHGNMVLNNTILCNTAGGAVEMGGTWLSWTTACSFKNNIVVNLGTGVCVDYPFFVQTPTPPNKLSACVTDNNAYYLPNGTQTIRVRDFPTNATRFAGTLAAWRVWQKNNPGLILPGGPGGYDAASVETDPGLVSLQPPFDIHLQSASPLVDQGTTKFVEAYQTFNQAHKVTADFEGDPRGTLIDIGADELAVHIAGSGAPAPGKTIVFSLSAPGDGGLPYQVGSSLGAGPTAIGQRQLGLSLDGLLVASVGGTLPLIFRAYAGLLDLNGDATARLAIPNIPALRGQRIHTAFVTLRAGVPWTIQSISDTFIFTIS